MNINIRANGELCLKTCRLRFFGIISLKQLIIMKLVLFLIVSISFGAFADVRAQRISIDVKNMPFKSVTQLIQKQTGISFAINDRLLAVAKPVTLSVNEQELEKALGMLFEDQPFDFRLEGKIIIVVPKTIPETISQQPVSISGTVTDSLNNPLQHVTVQVVGSSLQTSTDRDGKYILFNVPSAARLSFRLLSYETIEIPADRSVINVALKYVVSVLDETEVRGYYSTTRKLSTGNARTITSNEISTQPVGNPLLTLQGRFAGVSITQAMGTPGRNIAVSIRGRNSIANGNDPLYIIDGVPFASTSLMGGSYIANSLSTGSQNPLNSINVEDIESITVLKDADATAIYGSMGANGVILITTKTGNQSGRTQINADFYTGFGKVTGKMDLMNTNQYLEMRRESFANSGMQPGTGDYDLNGTWDTTRYTDWQEVLLGNTAKTTNSQLRFSGGNERTRFTVGGGYHKETVVYPGDFFDQKLSLQSSFNHQSSDDRFKVTFSVGYSNNRNQMPLSEIANGILLPPNAPPLFDEHGELNWQDDTWINPLGATKATNLAVTNNYLANGTVGYEVVKKLNLQVGFGINQIGLKQNITVPLSSFSPSIVNPIARRHNALDNQRRSWIIEPQASYQIELANGVLESLVGMTFREGSQEIIGLHARNFQNDDLIKNIAAGADQTINYFDRVLYRYHALYARIGYHWKDKYILNLTGRRDGSSRFGPGNQFGNFGAVGAAWVLSEESFFKPMKAISFAKLRTSYGITGNDQLSDYEYLSTYRVDNYTYLSTVGLVPTRHNNPHYGWESVRKAEIALELGFFNDKLQLTSNWYRNRTGNQLVGYPLPSITGFNTVRANLPAIVENSGLEFELSAQPISRGTLNWSIDGNISFPRNKLVSYPDFESSNYRTTFKVGESMSGQYRYVFDGINPTTGLFTFVDSNGDGTITVDDREYIVTEQKYFGGLTNNFSIGQFSLSVHFQFVNQVKPQTYYSPLGMQNVHSQIMSRWQGDGDEGKYHQRLSNSFNNELSYFGQSDAVLVDASFIRLKNMSFSYFLPTQNLQVLNIQQIELYLQGQNLLTVTRYGDADPETLVGTYIPPIRMFTAGIRLVL